MLTALGTHDEVVSKNLISLGKNEDAMYRRLLALQHQAKGVELTKAERRLIDGARHNTSLLADFNS